MPSPSAYAEPAAPQALPDVRPPAQTLHTERQLIETVSIPRLTLQVEREGGIGTQRAVVHDGDVCKIGSHASNDVVLRDPMVSRFHCRLVREDGIWTLRDSGSMNGTTLNGVRLRDGDVGTEGVLALVVGVLSVRKIAGAFVPVKTALRVGLCIAGAYFVGGLMPMFSKLLTPVIATGVVASYLVALVVTGELGKEDLALIVSIAGRRAKR